MKKTRLCTPLLVAALGTLFAHSAMASDGIISFNGKITANTCTVKLNETNSASSTVTLPTIAATALPNNNDVAGITAFKIELSGCVLTEAISVSTYFEPGSTVNAAGRLINSTGDSEGVDIQLLNKDLGVIAAGQESDSQNDVIVSMASDALTATLAYYAQYYRTGPITPGTLETKVNYTVVYD